MTLKGSKASPVEFPLPYGTETVIGYEIGDGRILIDVETLVHAVVQQDRDLWPIDKSDPEWASGMKRRCIFDAVDLIRQWGDLEEVPTERGPRPAATILHVLVGILCEGYLGEHGWQIARWYEDEVSRPLHAAHVLATQLPPEGLQLFARGDTGIVDILVQLVPDLGFDDINIPALTAFARARLVEEEGAPA